MLQEQAPTIHVVIDVIVSYLKKNVIDTIVDLVERVLYVLMFVTCALPLPFRYTLVFICVLLWIYVAIQPFASLVSYRRAAKRHKER